MSQAPKNTKLCLTLFQIKKEEVGLEPIALTVGQKGKPYLVAENIELKKLMVKSTHSSPGLPHPPITRKPSFCPHHSRRFPNN